MAAGIARTMTSVQTTLKRLVRSTFQSFGYDIVPFPIDQWSEQRLTLGRHLIQILRRCRINCVFDVGAHYGEYGEFLRELGYSGKLISFEPVSTNFKQLRIRAEKDPLWHAYHMALGSEDTLMDIKVFHESELSSFLTPNDYCASHMGSGDLVSGLERVQVRTVDTVFDECVADIVEPRVYLKLDTQGYELAVLQGATCHLDGIQGLQAEVSIKPIYEAMPSYLESLPKMRDLGFEVTGLFPVNRDRNLRLIEVDCVMVRNGAAEVRALSGTVR
jgi:FkbM family methyltransferase